MNADLDWTQTLGQAVLDQLEGVQDAIQDIRGFMRAVGGLESNDQMTVIAEGDLIRIEPADPNAVFIPQYDPQALLTALYSTDVTGPAAEEAGAVGSEAEAAAAPAEEAASEEAVQEEAVQEEVVPEEVVPEEWCRRKSFRRKRSQRRRRWWKPCRPPPPRIRSRLITRHLP